MIDLPGFVDAVHDSQSCFRAVLDAMSRPGQVSRVAWIDPPAPLAIATAAVVLTLLDAETPCWLDDGVAAARDWIAFHCGVHFTTRERAWFGVGLTLPPLGEFFAGTDDEPERGATVIVQVASLHEGQALHLTGPGVNGARLLKVTGLPPDFILSWARNHALFPRGVDLVLCAGAELACLPRTVAIGSAE